MKPASAVPEPSSFLMFTLALGVAALPGRVATFRRRDRRATRESARDRAPAQRAKRAIDVVGSTLGLTLSAPLVALSAIAIKLETPGRVFFGQTRCGKNGRTFKMWKLRSMVQNAEASQSTLQDDNAMDGPVFKIKGDPRITGVGRWLRRFSVDEVPQFWNVMRGEMSLVGPRPPLPSEVEQYGPRERRRLDVDPGLTCTWQVSGRNEIGFDEWMEIDLEYVENWTLTRDLVLIARTVPAIVNGRGSY
jgi:lipopolysaccharide/colanic/teichoic acid biosynthesis glycosyltransferase